MKLKFFFFKVIIFKKKNIFNINILKYYFRKKIKKMGCEGSKDNV